MNQVGNPQPLSDDAAAAAHEVLAGRRRGWRSIELAISALVAPIGLCCLAELLLAPVDWPAAGVHRLRPSLHGEGAPLVAVGTLGAVAGLAAALILALNLFLLLQAAGIP